MGININDLDNNLQPVGASLLSGNESLLDSLRELSDEEQKLSGGGKKDGSGPVYIDNGYAGYFFYGGGGGKKGSSGPTVISRGIYGGGYGGGYGGYPGYGGGGIDVNVSANAGATSRASSY